MPEIATSLSAGRFSRCFGTPSYEASAVTAYHKAFSAGLFDDVNRRRYSDVSIREVKFKIVVDGSAGTVDGTSCECPAFVSVSMIAPSNDRLIAAGKSTLRVLNAWMRTGGIDS